MRTENGSGIEIQISRKTPDIYGADFRRVALMPMNLQHALHQLNQVFDIAGINPKIIAEEYCDAHRKKITARLNILTGLSGVLNVRCIIDRNIPPHVATILERELDDRVLWVMAHFAMLDQTTMVLKSASSALISERERAKGQDVLGHAAGYLSEDLAAAKLHAKFIVDRILERGVDGVLGYYHPGEKRIELFYYPIWLVSQTHRVRYEDALFVVLAHEFAHAYSHLGQDGDGHSWDLDKFWRADREIIKGLAEHFI